jgi:hypothetical protein
MSVRTYFRYHDPNTDCDFFFDTETEETCWNFPEEGIVLDAVTREQVFREKSQEFAPKECTIDHERFEHTVEPPKSMDDIPDVPPTTESGHHEKGPGDSHEHDNSSGSGGDAYGSSCEVEDLGTPHKTTEGPDLERVLADIHLDPPNPVDACNDGVVQEETEASVSGLGEGQAEEFIVQEQTCEKQSKIEHVQTPDIITALDVSCVGSDSAPAHFASPNDSRTTPDSTLTDVKSPESNVLDPEQTHEIECSKDKTEHDRSREVPEAAFSGDREDDSTKKDPSSSKRRKTRHNTRLCSLQGTQCREMPNIPVLSHDRIIRLAQTTPTFRTWAEEHFRKSKSKSKPISYSFSSSPLSDPLLARLPKSAKKDSIRVSKTILKICGLYSKSSDIPNSFCPIIELCIRDKDMCDEVCAQLIKQTIDSPLEPLGIVLGLLLTFVTMCSPGISLIGPLVNRLSVLAASLDKNIATLAEFTYIRLETQLKGDGGVLRDVFVKKELIEGIRNHHVNSHFWFGVTLWEIHWQQRATRPRLPIPYVLHEMSEALFRLNAENTQGIFRSPGNMNKLKVMMRAANHGDPYLVSDDPCDVASLFKYWFREVPGGIIDKERTEQLGIMRMGDPNGCMEIVGSLDFPNRAVLMFLIGFLRRLAKSEPVTLMGVPNLAMVFAPNIVCQMESEDFAVVSKITAGANAFLTQLITSWDVSMMYPVNNSWL